MMQQKIPAQAGSVACDAVACDFVTVGQFPKPLFTRGAAWESISESFRIFDYPHPFKWAIKEALKSTHRHRVGAVLVAHGKPIARGHNSIRRHKFSNYYQYPEACHAEAAALSEVAWEGYNGLVLYVTRLNLSGKMMMARPCASCFRLLKDQGIRKVIYTTNHGFAEETII